MADKRIVEMVGHIADEGDELHDPYDIDCILYRLDDVVPDPPPGFAKTYVCGMVVDADGVLIPSTSPGMPELSLAVARELLPGDYSTYPKRIRIAVDLLDEE